MLSCECSSSKYPHIELHILHMELTYDKVKFNIGYEINGNSTHIMKDVAQINEDFAFLSI